MSHPLIRKLEHSAALSQAERSALETLTLNRRSVSARHDIAVYDNTDRVYLVTSGIAGRYRTLRQGSRRIVSFAVPGDLCRMHTCGPSTRDMRLGALTHCSVADIPRARLAELIETHPGIARAMRWLALMELSRAREWLVNDSRPADRRLAHHFRELLVCLQVVGLADENSFELAISQADLADAMGISQVHINRVLQGLRADDLIVWSKSALTIPDVERLQAFAGFDPGYLDLRAARAA
ncbi:Crp/Fnr family transcriptional regulator [Methylobacterium durans]|uniref:Crp/Fnr family transcriptional regulator n=1 Tax=Methylobacterium durans TaxID=2202825 RepID=A0A2U8W4N0_9HYPH|nr:Crp/Fnr family transcriptional regulator [Methylobacterium durans]AWN40470.1 Crp/Fnr family transcriptional regulator [Methylobacterium durans]